MTDTPADVQTAFHSAGVEQRFLQLPPSHRAEYLTWIEQAKRPETRQRRIERAVKMIRARQPA